MPFNEILKQKNLVPSIANLLALATSSDRFLMMPEEKRTNLVKNVVIAIVLIDRAQGCNSELQIIPSS